MIDLVGTLRRELTSLAGPVADHIADRLLPAMKPGRGQEDLVPVLQRARLLLLQGATSMLADGIGAALLRRSYDSSRGATLRAAVERIRVGAVGDSAGNIRAMPR